MLAAAAPAGFVLILELSIQSWRIPLNPSESPPVPKPYYNDTGDGNDVPWAPGEEPIDNSKEGEQCPAKVGDNTAPPPSNCSSWKAQVLSQKEMAETLFLVSERPMVIAEVNHKIKTYNANCEKITGKVSLLFVNLNDY